MPCTCTAPGFCPARNMRVRWADIQSCPNRTRKESVMATPCVCSGPGFCPKYGREMNQADWDICWGGVEWLKADHVGRWMKETGTTCEYDQGPLLDEHGIPIKKRGCGCNGRPPVVQLKSCTHPQMVAAKTPGEEGCEHRCSFFTAKLKAGRLPTALNGSD